MTIQTINIGNQVNDGLGDDLRSAFQKVNANFTELNNTLTITASNLNTSTGIGIFKQKVGNNLEFKSLVAGNKITLESINESIIVNSSQPDAFVSITTDNGTVIAATNTNPSLDTTKVTLKGGDNVRVGAVGRVVTVDTVLDIGQILVNYDFGTITGANMNPVQLSLAFSNIDFGLFTNPGRLSVDLGTL